MPSIVYTIDVHEDAWFALHLGGAHEALPEGDFKITCEDKVWLVERKTWGDAYSSFRSKRVEDQLSRMLLATPNTILLIEGRKEAVYTNDRQQIKNLQAKDKKNYSTLAAVSGFRHKCFVDQIFFHICRSGGS